MASFTRDDLAHIHETISNELTREPQEIADRLQTEIVRKDERMRQGDYLDLVARGWSDPGWRAELLDRVGPVNFIETAHALRDHIAENGWPSGATPVPQDAWGGQHTPPLAPVRPSEMADVPPAPLPLGQPPETAP